MAIFRETCEYLSGGEYIPPSYDVPTVNVSTLDGYNPTLRELENFINK